jgi:hypothetical protein
MTVKEASGTFARMRQELKGRTTKNPKLIPLRLFAFPPFFNYPRLNTKPV